MRWRAGKDDRESYIKERKELKEMIKKKEEEERTRFIEKVIDIKTETQVWKLLNSFKKREKGISEEISLEE